MYLEICAEAAKFKKVLTTKLILARLQKCPPANGCNFFPFVLRHQIYFFKYFRDSRRKLLTQINALRRRLMGEREGGGEGPKIIFGRTNKFERERDGR